MSSLNARSHLVAADPALPSGEEGSTVRVLDRIILVVLCTLLAFGPLAFGAVQDWAIFTLEAGAALCIVLWAVREMVRGRLEIHHNRLFLPILLFAGLVHVQLLTGHTAYWYVTWRKSLLWGAFAALFFVASQCLQRTAGRKHWALFFTVFGALVALFAIVQQFTWNGKIYWFVANRNGGWVYGPYVNHAHYAGLMEMLLPIPLVFAMMSRWRKHIRILFGFAALLMASTVFLSRSLGGILAFGVQMGTLAILVRLRGRSRQQLLILPLLGVLLAALLLTLSPGGIARTIARLHDPIGKEGAGDRLLIVKDSLKMIAARPVLGWGLGTFSVVYPSFRSYYTNFVVNEAHNDYIQTAVETGMLGFGIACGFIALFYRSALGKLERWRTDILAALTLAVAVGVTGILVHSLCDFNLQIPANAALFFTITGLATGTTKSEWTGGSTS